MIQMAFTECVGRCASLIRRGHDASGQTLVEYALIIALIAIAVTATLSGMSGAIAGVFQTISNTLTG